MNEEQEQKQTEERPAEETQRDFRREVEALLEAFPELAGESLPDEVTVRSARGEDLTAAYRAYEKEQADRRAAERERRERAPVRGVTGGERVRELPEDDFLRGFREA